MLLIALVTGAVAIVSLVRTARRSERRDWLPGALRALTMVTDPADLAALLTRHVQIGLGVARVEWWRREDGLYRGPSGHIEADVARHLDRWVVLGAAWQHDDPLALDAGTIGVLRDTGAVLVVPLRSGGRALGFLALGARADGRPYRDTEVAELAAVADHLALVVERARVSAMLGESQRMLQQATRLSTVGTLAAELAHEIRNPLVAVQTFLQLLPERLDDPEVTGDLRAVALTELQRVARLLNELLGMARASVANFASTDLEAVVEQVVRFLQVSAHKKDVVLARAGDPLPTAAADASRLKQALVNLVLNAIQASPVGTTVTVTTTTSVDANDQPVVELAIHDQGPGVPVEQRETIFHPFFTTKENGTGLGLPVTRQIIADHGGSIAVEGAVGRGATFVVRLPLMTATVERHEPTGVRAA